MEKNQKLFSEVKIYSVDEITTCIKNILEENKALQNITVKGEISNFRHHNSRHMYFNLKDENSIIKCAMFERTNGSLEFGPKDGTEVIVKGYVEVYKIKGEYQIIVEEMIPAGKGALYEKFLNLKGKLEKEGLFDPAFKKQIPKMPKKIGIVTSLEGAAIKDIIKTISKRFPYIELIICPSLVQGVGAKYQIERGIELLNQINPDIIIIARGGGSFEDLWPFNEENVARAIFNSNIPVITGIGHETDFTISDFVADKRAHTPTAAAEAAVPNIEELENNLMNLERRLVAGFSKIKEIYFQRLEHIKNKSIFRRPTILIEQYLQILDDKENLLIKIVANKNELMKKDIFAFQEKLNALSPKAILKRGYSITLKDNEILRSIKDINKDDLILTVFADGSVSSKVE